MGFFPPFCAIGMEITMIKNIIFDIGNVLVEFRPEKVFLEIGVSPEKIEGLANATVYSPLWPELDRGIMREEDVFQKMKEASPEYAKEIGLISEKAIEELVHCFDYSADWLKGLQERGYKVFLLSNYPKSFFELHSKKHFSFLPYIDGKVVSAYVNLIKPDIRIYETLLNKYNLKPEECVFLDDREENVEGAEKAGIHGIQFLSYDDANRKLEQMLR